MNKQGGACHTIWPCPFTLKNYLNEKEEFWKTQIFHHAKIYNSQKIPLKETKILQYIFNFRN